MRARRGLSLAARLLAGAALSGCMLAASSVAAAAQFSAVHPPAPCHYDARAATVAAQSLAEPSSALAVLTFRRASSGERYAYVSAIASEIAARLYRVDRALVRRPAALDRTPAPSPAGIVTLGKNLGVRFLLSATVDVSDGTLAVVPRLFRASDGAEIWTARYEQPLAALESIERQISREVAERVGMNLSPEQTATLARPRTQNAAAYNHFVRGSFHVASGTTLAAVRAIAELERAVALDASFGAAYARLGIAHATILQAGRQLRGVTHEGMINRGTTAANRALALDSSSVEAWLARAAMLTAKYPRSYEGVRGAYARAVAADPQSAEALRLYGRSLMHMGNLDAAEVRLRSAVELDPESRAALHDLADLYVYRRRPSDACRFLNRALQTDPRAPRTYALRAAVRLHWGEVRDAWADAETASRLGDKLWGESAAALVDAQSRDTTAARVRMVGLSRQTLAGLSVLSAEDARLPALAYTAIGDSTSAKGVLERVRPRGAALWMVLQDPGFDRARRHGWFRSLLQQTSRGASND